MMFALLTIVCLAVAVMVALGLNTSFVPTPQDEANRLESSVTKTADFNGTSFDHGAGFAPGGIGMPVAAVVDVSALETADADETYAFKLQESDDDSTFTDAGPSVSVTAAGVKSVPGFLSKRYTRLFLDVGGTTPSITYEAWLNPNVG